MKLLVTGGAGFIGSNFVHYVSKEKPDWQITVIDKLTYAGDRARLSEVNDKIEFVEADICDEAVLEKILPGVELVVHFAAESHVDRSIADPGPFLRTNILGTELLLRLSLRHGVKHFHHVSTDEVFGSLPLNNPARFSETTPYDPRSPYSASKAASDHLVRTYGETYGLTYTITNCSNNYGPWDSPGRAIPVFITNLLQDQPIGLYGDGSAVRDYLHVRDHCEAIMKVIESGKKNETYCVGGHDGESSGTELANLLVELMGKDSSMITFVKDRPGHDMRYAIDASKITSELGWKPSISLRDGLTETIAWYTDHSEWWQDYKKRISLLRD